MNASRWLVVALLTVAIVAAASIYHDMCSLEEKRLSLQMQREGKAAEIDKDFPRFLVYQGNKVFPEGQGADPRQDRLMVSGDQGQYVSRVSGIETMAFDAGRPGWIKIPATKRSAP